MLAAKIMKLTQQSLVEKLDLCALYQDSIPCFEKMAGPTLFCAERIDWIDSFKPALENTSSLVQNSVAYPFKLLDLDPQATMPYSLAPFAISEELFCRGFVQNGLLRALPRKAIEWFSPTKGHLVDHPIARIARVAISAGFFALLHTNKWECVRGGTLPQLVAGAIFATIGEYSLFGACLAHVAKNLTIYGLGESLPGSRNNPSSLDFLCNFGSFEPIFDPKTQA